MLLTSLLIGLIFRLTIKEISINCIFAVIDLETLRLIGIIFLVCILSNILKKIESLKGIVDSLQEMVIDFRLILAIIPSFLGLLPMPAGAILSAPLVDEVGNKIELSAEEKTFVNYWFRHLWEFIWPLYPSIILFSTLLEVEIWEIIIVQFPITLVSLIIGLTWEYKYLRTKKKFIKKENIFLNVKKLFFNAWPILLVIFLVLFLRLNLILALSVVLLILISINRIKIKDIIEIIRRNIPVNTLFLIVSIMIFKRMLNASGMIMVTTRLFTELKIHTLVILFSVPFLVGILIGVTPAIIGITIPFLLPFIVIQGRVILNYAMFVFVAGHIGHMLSPVHLCLLVTKDYFKADIVKIYKMLILPLFILLITAFFLVTIRVQL